MLAPAEMIAGLEVIAKGTILRYNHAGFERTANMKQRKYFLRWGMAATAALTLAVGSWKRLGALPLPQDTSTNFTLEGTISAQSPGKLTVDTGGQMIFHVTYDKNTVIHKKDGSAGTAADLVVGAKIRVAGDLNNSGVVEARKIDLE
jgi:hypothetical protein